MDRSLQDLAAALELARRRGARGAEVLVEKGEGARLACESGRIVARSPRTIDRAVVRVWLDGGRAGRAAGEWAALDGLLDRALADAEGAPEDALAGPVGRLVGGTRAAGVDDRRYAMVEADDRVEAIVSLERGAASVDPRVRTGRFTYDDDRTWRGFANSKGVVGEEWSTTFRAEGHVSIAGEPDLALGEVVAARAFASIAALPFGTTLAQRLIGLLDAPAVGLDRDLPVFLPPRVTAEIVERIAPSFDARALAARESFVAVAAAEGRAWSPFVHLLDDGTLPGALRTRSFDDRGVGPVPVNLVREGLLEGRYLDPEEARRRDTRPTGHVSGDGNVPSNLLFRSGNRSISALLADQSGLEVLVLDHATIEELDLVTGAITLFGAGVVRRGGDVYGAVRKVRLRGRLDDVFSSVLEIASDTDRYGHVDAPAILVRGLSLA